MKHLLTLVLLLSPAHAQSIRLALDWVPNTNHTGIYVALANGYYDDEGVTLHILPYGSVSPTILVASGRADVGIAGAESVLSAAAVGEPVVSVAAIMSSNTAALAVREDSGIRRPRDLDGRLHAAVGVPYEDPAIAAVIRSDGGAGEFDNVQLAVAGFEAVLQGRADFAWVFAGWQGVQAEREGVPLRLFNFRDYGVPDYYTPVFTASPEGVANNAEALRAFLRATARGYTFAAENPQAAAELLLETAPAGSFPDPGLVRDSQTFVSRYYIEEGRPWGVQRPEYWEAGYPEFLLDAGVFTDTEGNVVRELDLAALYTNTLLPEGE